MSEKDSFDVAPLRPELKKHREQLLKDIRELRAYLQGDQPADAAEDCGEEEAAEDGGVGE